MIHSEHPYRDAPDDRDPARRFRGRLAAPVSVVTSGEGERRTGLTVSSLFVVEGDPAVVHLVVGPTTDLWETGGETGRIAVHIARTGQEHLADVFAGLRPSPGGVFAGVHTTPSPWGPLIDSMPDRALCTVTSRRDTGYSGVMTADVDEVHATDLVDPLVYFRGRYRALG